MLRSRLKLTNLQELKKIHNKTMDILSRVGMKINEDHMLENLEKQGCKVSRSSKRVYFKIDLVEKTIEDIKEEISNGKLKQKILNGILASKTDGKLRLKFGGACIEYYDFEKDIVRTPTSEDIISALRLGEAIPEVDFVGNVMMYLKENGKEIDPRLQRIKACELVAKNTSKPGSCEVWNPKELELLVEMGIVVRGSKKAFLENPCFITAKETISPLVLENEAAVVLLALAKYGLPCTIIPMPIIGISTPLARESAITICNAEILGTMTAIRSIYPDAKVAGGVVSGSVNMRTGGANYATPEAITQDLILAELYEDIYGQDFGIGVGATDAKYPGIETATEKLTKIITAYLTGRTNFVVGVIKEIMRFSPEQAIIEIELSKYVHEIFKEINVNDDTAPLDSIEKLGPGGHFFKEDNTLLNFKNNLWLTDIFDKSKSTNKISDDKKRDIILNANRRVKEILSGYAGFNLDKEKEKEINNIVKKAEEIL